LGVIIPVGNCLGREAGEDYGMNRADARAGEHRNHELRHHRHVDRNNISLTNAQRLNTIRSL